MGFLYLPWYSRYFNWFIYGVYENGTHSIMAENNKLTEYVYMGIAIGVGTLLVWDLTTTNDNTKAINDIVKDISGQQKDHRSEVDRSSKVDSDQEIDIEKNVVELARQLGFIHKQGTSLAVLIDRSNRDYDGKDLPQIDHHR